MKTDLPLRERVRLTLRTYRLIRKTCLGLMQLKVWRALVVAVSPLITLFLSAQIVGEIAAGRDIGRLALLCGLTVGLGFVLTMLRGWLDTMYNNKEQQMWSYFGKIFADKQLEMDYAMVEDASIQRQKQLEKENLFNLGNGLGQFVWSSTGLIEGAISVLGSVSLVVTLFALPSGRPLIDSPLWILLIALALGVGIWVNAVATRREQSEFLRWSEGALRFNRVFTFFGWTLCVSPEKAKDVRLYCQDKPADAVLGALEKSEKADAPHRLRMAIHEPIATFVTLACGALCTLFVALKAFFGAFGVGGIVQYLGALTKLGSGAQQLIFSITDNAILTHHLKSLFAFLDIPSAKRTGTLPAPKALETLELRHVSFRYPCTDSNALHDISLTLRAGQRLALVGMNGSGKSTLVKLLCRLYEPAQGEILLNDVDIRQYDYDAYRSLLSVVFQDFALFAFPLGQNVAASAEYDADRARECLDKAGFGARLELMPNGLDTCVNKDYDEQGVEVSGGETQKIALARALYKDAPIIVLDEPTAALDPVAEFEVYTRFNDIVGGKTAIYISHRLASCRFCDDIAVFDKGRLIQRGSHDALVAQTDGLYAAMWQAQAQYYQ